MAGIADYIPPFLPTKPQTTLDYRSFPNDLVSDGRQFCMDIQFMMYDPSLTSLPMTFPSIFTPFITASYSPNGGVTLPIPKSLNDIQTVVWEPVSATSVGVGMLSSVAGVLGGLRGYGMATALAAGGSATAAVGGLAPGGLAVNPHLFMLFKSPSFKEYSFKWTLAPKNEQESETLRNIITQFKYNMLPAMADGMVAGSFLLNYPSIAIIKMYPNDLFTFRLKPCAIKSVHVDYAPTGQPSFFKRTGAPTAVNLTINLVEIQYLTKDNYFL